MPLISVTRLRLRHWRYFPAFLFWAIRSSNQAGRAPGNLGKALQNDPRMTFWTCTAWQDEGAMRAFMLSGVHREAMPKLVEWCDEASVVHWTQDSAVLPSWAEAHRRMLAEGRRSKVRYPSPDHEAFRFPPPENA